MVRLVAVAALAAAFASSSADASTTCAKCATSTCNADYLATVTVNGPPASAPYTCATGAVNGSIPSNLVFTPNTQTVAPNAVTVLLNILGDKSLRADQIFHHQPFGFGAVNLAAQQFVVGAAKVNSIPGVTCSTPYNMPLDVDPNTGNPVTFSPLSEMSDLATEMNAVATGQGWVNLLCPETSALPAQAQQALGLALYEALPTIQQVFIYQFASGLFLKLAPCFLPTCKPLVTYLCNNLTPDYSVPSGASSLASNQLVQATGALGTLAKNSIAYIDSVLGNYTALKAAQTPDQQNPYAPGAGVLAGANITGLLTSLPCSQLQFQPDKNAAGMASASFMAAAASVSAAMFSL